MKKIILITLSILLTTQAHARNEYKEFSVIETMQLEVFKNKLGDDVKFYFGDSLHSKIIKTYGEWPSLKKTNAFNKTDEYACQWALLSGLLSLKKRALREGGNAVIVRTNNDHRAKSNSKMFECEIGNIIASVALLGKVIKIKR